MLDDVDLRVIDQAMPFPFFFFFFFFIVTEYWIVGIEG